MLTWFRNRWPDPRIREREEELRGMVERHEEALKEWYKRHVDLVQKYDRLAAMPPEAKVVEMPVYIDKISSELVEENRVLRKKLEIALGRLHTWDHNQAISIEKMKAKDV